MPKNKNNYWAERARKDKLKVIRTGEQGIDNLKRLLLLNLKDVEKQIKDFYEKYGENPAEELSNKNWQRYKKRLSDMAKANPQDKTLQKLAKQNIPKYKIDRLRALELDLQMQLTEATNGQAKGIYNTLDDVSKVSQATFAKRYKDTFGLTFNAIASNKMKQILMSDWSGANWSERLWKDREKVGKKLTEVLEKGIPQGTSLQKMSRELRDLTGQSFNNAFRLIRTETSHIDGQVTLEGYKQAGKELGLEYYEYDAFLDTRTSSICRELNGNRFKVSEAEVGVNYPPMHPNCRSTTQLVLDEEYKQEEKPEIEEQQQEKRPLYNSKLTKESQSFVKSLGEDYTNMAKEVKEYRKERKILIEKLDQKAKEIKKADRVAYNFELRKEYNDMIKKYRELNQNINNLNNQKINIVSQKLAFKGGGGVILGKTTNTTKDVALRLQKDLENIIHKDLIKDIKLETAYTRDSRNYFSPSYNKIFINKDTKRSTAIHEAMHWLEHNNKDLGDKVSAFLEYRTQGEDPQKLKDLVPNSNYKWSEIAKKDNFFSPYCGKIYQGGGTEILSMGLEEIFDNAIEFSEKDPEYFNFVLDVIQKRI